MKNLLLIAEKDSVRADAFLSVSAENYTVRQVYSAREAIELLSGETSHYEAAVIDAPADRSDARKFLSYVKRINNYVFALPVMVLTDKDRRTLDEPFLDDTVIGLIEQGDSAPIIRQKIEIAVNVINSVTFSEFSKMLKELPSLIYLKDNKGRYVFCSKYMHHLEHFDDPDWTIRGKTDMEIRKDKDNARKAYESDLRIIATGKGTSYVIEENDGDGKEYLQLIKEPLHDKHGRVNGIIAIINNVTEQETLKRELRKKSITDELTGLHNRTYFDEYTERLCDMDYPLTMISADCDGLKTVNDLYGHTVGDEYIRMAVTLFKTVLPESAVKFRTGGDEFLFFLPNTDRETAEGYMKQLEKDERSFVIKDHTLSVSFGAYTLNEPGVPIGEAVTISDAEMYRHKREKKRKAAAEEKT